jgi:sugar phosphate isomerase/epimerase
MPDRAALNLVTLGPASLETKLYAAATAGFSAVGLLREEMEQAGESGREELRLTDLRTAELMGLSGWTDSSPTGRSLAFAQAEAAFQMAADLGCSVVIAWPPQEPVEFVAAARAFADLCRLAQPFSVQVALEFLGNCSGVNTVAAAWEIVELAEAPNGGLVLDTFHFYRGGSALEMLDPVPGDKILHLQDSDSVDMPRHELEDRHRVYPGEGAIPLDPLLAAVREKGYSGYYSLELHNEAYWQEDPVVVAREGLRAMRRLDIT